MHWQLCSIQTEQLFPAIEFTKVNFPYQLWLAYSVAVNTRNFHRSHSKIFMLTEGHSNQFCKKYSGGVF